MLDSRDLENIHAFPLVEDSLVWIVGGYSGKTAAFYADTYNPYVEIFEPQVAFATMLAQKFADNPKVVVHPFGLWDRKGRQPMALGGTDGATFVYPVDYAGEMSEDAGFLDIIEAIGKSQIDLLFLNCEGSEFGILSRMLRRKRLAQVKYLMVQFHPLILGAHVNHYERLCERISQTHCPITDWGPTWRSWRRDD